MRERSCTSLEYGRGEDELRRISEAWLDVAKSPSDGLLPRPFHWIEFPEAFVSTNAGFDGVLGNPPFVGDADLFHGWPFLPRVPSRGSRPRKARTSGSRRVLPAPWLRLGAGSQVIVSLVATNTLAQGGTREIGLDAVGSGLERVSGRSELPLARRGRTFHRTGLDLEELCSASICR